MYINLQINLAEGDNPPTQDAKAILTDLGGDPSKDTISVSVSAGYAPPPPPPSDVINIDLPQP